ncbi:ferredoxin--NADP reductase [Spirochaeta cellobiosiphila]|uniref:ferredoxin--NADP reductase n=1 Tax=Spirochaeta cellobiosiphila TaxID=504483 RepID=UPI00040B0AE2|nr:FAD-dependent oxidoreductase [Spirochaeta cellobiosiphila]
MSTLLNRPAPKMYEVELIKIVNEYDEVYSYYFKSNESIPFKAGHHTHLVAPNVEIERAFVRHMSIASTPKDNEIVFSMDLSSQSPYKLQFRNAKVGDRTKIFKFGGDFLLDMEKLRSKVVYIAGGIGITPIRSLIRQAEQEKLDIQQELIYVGKGYMYTQELDDYGFPIKRIKRPDVPDTLKKAATEKPDALFYICGSVSFIDAMRQQLIDFGIGVDSIIVENFTKNKKPEELGENEIRIKSL